MFGIPMVDLFEAGIFIWVLDKYGNKKRVKVRNEEHRKQLLAQNRAMRAKLAAKKVTPKKSLTKKRKVKKHSEWDF